MKRMLGRLAAVVVLLTALVGLTPTSASAGGVYCYAPTTYGILGGAGGGCDGYGGGGHDRLVVYCTGMRGSALYISGPWMHRYQSWYYRVWCPGGYGYWARSAWYEHVAW